MKEQNSYDYNFDKLIDRRDTNAVSMEGFRGYLFDGYENLEFPVPDEDLIKMWVADMEFETAPEILEAIRDRLDHGILGYTMIFDEDYNKSITQWIHDRHGYKYDESHIVSSKGVIPALFSLTKYLCAPDEKVLFMTPSYAFFKYAADANGTEAIFTDLIYEDEQYIMNYDDIAQKVADPLVSTLIFCNPHNPTGRLWTEDEIKKLGEICFAHNVTVISDEIHCDILRRGSVFTPFQKVFPQSDRIITCISASKTFNLAGMLMANVIIPNDDIREKWNADHLPIENPLSVSAYHAAYNNGAPWLAALTEYLDGNFALLKRELSNRLTEAVFNVPESTYLAWIDVSHYFPAETDLTIFFAEKAGVLLEGGNMFLDNADGHIRLNLACPTANLQQGIDRIIAAINSNSGSTMVSNAKYSIENNK